MFGTIPLSASPVSVREGVTGSRASSANNAHAMQARYSKGFLKSATLASTVACSLFVLICTTQQTEAQCSSSVSGVPSSVNSCGGFYFGNVQIASTCLWSVASSTSWAHVSGGGTGPSSFSIRFDVNSGGSRSATITVSAPDRIYIYVINQSQNNPPTSPSPITIDAVSPTSVSFHWTQSVDPDGCSGNFIDHDVELWQGGTRIRTAGTTSTSYPFGGLTELTAYQLRVRGVEQPDIFGPEISGSTATRDFTTPRANTAPAVSITSPTGGQVFHAPANITISASASDTGGNVTKVEFFYSSTKIGEDTTSPYSIDWSGVPVGSYSLTAKATSAAVGIRVDPPPPGPFANTVDPAFCANGTGRILTVPP